MSAKQYPAIVQEIHKSFETAGDKLLAEANEVLRKCGETDVEKGKRLAKIGFTATREAKLVNEVMLEEGKAQSIAIAITDYQRRYPLCKIITQKQVDEICKKYNLINAPISRYTGFVPVDKLQPIEQFKLKEQDRPEPLYKVVKWRFDDGQKDEIKLLKKDIFEASEIGGIGSSTTHVRTDNGHVFIDSYETIDRGAEHVTWAPKKDFDLKDLGQKGCAFFKSELFKVSAPDPVVLQELKGGYFAIICAWGDEASDPIVVNQINN